MQTPSIQMPAGVDSELVLAQVRESALQGAPSGKDAETAGRHFEALLGSMLAQEMRRGLDEGFFGSGPGADTFGAWLDGFVGEAMAERGALGTTDLVKNFAAGAARAYAAVKDGEE